MPTRLQRLVQLRGQIRPRIGRRYAKAAKAKRYCPRAQLGDECLGI
jgi:hypothetical protein